jgi:hypothetical protein
VDPADDLNNHGAEEPAARTNGRSQRCRGPWFIGAATDRRLVGTVVTAAAENSLPATPIDRATRGRTI